MGRQVFLLGPALALALLPSNVVATALPLLRQEWAASATEMGWVFAAYQAGYVAAVLVLLPLTDRVAAERVIAACCAATTLASLLFPLLARDVWTAAALRASMGAGLAGIYLPGVRVVAGSVPRARRGLAVGVYVSAFYAGTALSLWSTGALLAVTDWRGAALGVGMVSVLALPLAMAARPAGAPAVEASGALRLAVMVHGPLLRTILAYAGHSWELYVARGWLAAFLAATLATDGLAGAEVVAEGGKWAALMAGLGGVGVWLGGWLSDRVGRARAAAGIAAASGSLSLLFGWLGGVGWAPLLVVGCLHGMLMAADSGIYSAAVTERAPLGQLGSAQAAQAFLGFLASTVSPVAAGLVLDLGGGFGGVFALAGLASLAGALALLPLTGGAEPRPDEARGERQ